MGETSERLESNPNTEYLVGKAKSGSNAAWRKILEKYRRMLEAHVRARIPGFARRRFDVDDVLQTAFLNAWEHRQTFEFRGEGSFRRWLATLVVHACTNELRRPHESSPAEGGEIEEIPNSETQVELSEERVAMLEAIGQLEEEDRDILIQRHFEDMTFDEIARIQECPRERARTIYAQALARLQRRLRA